MNLKDKLFSFEGRLRRRDWWLLTLAFFAVRALCMDLSRLALFGPAYAMVAPGRVDWEVVNRDLRLQILHVVFMLLSFWPTAALASKRVHDRGHSAVPMIGLLVVISLINVVEVFMAYPSSSPFTGGLLGTLLMLAAALYMLIVLGILDGTRGPNRFGPSPKATTDDAVVEFG